MTAPDGVRAGRHMKTPPWGHQIRAIDFLASTLARYRAAMLAMDMGTGKSYLGVSMASNLKKPRKPADHPEMERPLIDRTLILCPLRVVDVWPEQFARHSARTDIRVVALGDKYPTVRHKTEAAKQAFAGAGTDHVVIVVNYESAWREPFRGWALKQQWGLVILDESHRIKQHDGRASRFARLLGDVAVYRLALTGTPLPHTPLDIFAQFRFLHPGIFGIHFGPFKIRYSVTGGFENRQVVGYQNLDELEEKMRVLMFRVGKEVLDLPPESIVTEYCALDPDARRIYKRLEEDFIAGVLDGQITAANAMVKLLRLQQLTGGYATLDDGRIVRASHAKQDLLEEVLSDIAVEEPIVVFCKFLADMRSVHEAAERTGRRSAELSGSVNELKAWQSGSAQILVVQIESGGTGIDLTRASYSIYYSLTFSLASYLQSMARLHRPGQTRPVIHIQLAVRGTIDTKIMHALRKRQDVVDSILSEAKEGALCPAESPA
jgi:SNF2 family DNA or RNA helicase